MKKTKFLAMLLAVFTLSFTSCGDDDDTPAPKPNEETTTNVKQNELKIRNSAITFEAGNAWETAGNHILIRFEKETDDEFGRIMLDLYNISMSNGVIPNGSYPVSPNRDEITDKPCFFMHGSVGFIDFRAIEGSSKVKIEHNGDNKYTITFDKLVLECYDCQTEESFNHTTKFTFKGLLTE